MPDDIQSTSNGTSSGSATPEEQELNTLIENTSLDEVTIDAVALAAVVDETPLPKDTSADTKNTHSLAGIEDISSYIQQKKQEQLKKPSSEALVAMDGTDLITLNNIYAIVPHSKGDHKLVYFRNDVPKDTLDDEKGRTKGTTYIKNTVPIYTVHVDMKRHRSLKGADQKNFDVRVIDSPKDLDDQLEAIKQGKGGGANFDIPIMVHPERASFAKKQSQKADDITSHSSDILKEETPKDKKESVTVADQKTSKKVDHKKSKTPHSASPEKTQKKPASKEHPSVKETKEVSQEKKKEPTKHPHGTAKEKTGQSKEVNKKEIREKNVSPQPQSTGSKQVNENNRPASTTNEQTKSPLIVPDTSPAASDIAPSTPSPSEATDSSPLEVPTLSPTAEPENKLQELPPVQESTLTPDGIIVDPEDETINNAVPDTTTESTDQISEITNNEISEEPSSTLPETTNEEFSNRLSPFQDAPYLPEEPTPSFSLTEDDITPVPEASSFAVSVEMTQSASEETMDQSVTDTLEHDAPHLFKTPSEEAASESMAEKVILPNEDDSSRFHSAFDPPKKTEQESTSAEAIDTNDLMKTTPTAAPKSEDIPSVVPPEKNEPSSVSPEQISPTSPEAAATEKITESSPSEHHVLDLDSLDLGAPIPTSSESKTSTQPTSVTTKSAIAKKVPSASSLKTMSIVLRVGGLVLFFGISVIIRNIMFPASKENPAPANAPTDIETGDTIPTDNPFPIEQPLPSEPTEEIPTQPSPTEELPDEEPPAEEIPQQQYTIPELIKKMEAQELDARRLLNKAKLLGNRDAIKFATAALLKASSAIEKAEKDSSVTADELQEDATRTDLYLQQASSLLE